MNRWKSLWVGPDMSDFNEHTRNGISYYSVWGSSKLFALDMEDRPWTLCQRLDHAYDWKWLRVEDLVSGAAGRQTLAEEAA